MPSTSWARQVPHTPPRHANGRSERTLQRGLEDAHVVGAQLEVGGAAVELDRHVRRAFDARRDDLGWPRDRVGVEQLGVDRGGLHPVLDDDLAQVDHHLLRAAQEPLVDVAGREQRVEDPGEALAVEPPGEEVDVLLLA